jgi:cytochrome c oxidase cbb3-type subunit 3
MHGSKINDLFKTIKYGVLAKGMPTWEKQLSPKQIADVANYVKSLHGTHPAGAKEPQGTKESDTDDKLVANK